MESREWLKLSRSGGRKPTEFFINLNRVNAVEVDSDGTCRVIFAENETAMIDARYSSELLEWLSGKAGLAPDQRNS